MGTNKRINKLKFKKYVTFMNFKKSDLLYHKEEHIRRRALFHSEVTDFMINQKWVVAPERAAKNLIDVYEKRKNIDAPDLNNECNKMFKKIAKSTHPDIDPDELKKKIFIKAKEAQEEKDWFSLYGMALDLDLELPKISEEQVLWMEQEINKIDALITKIETTLEWIYCDGAANKQHLLTTYCMATCRKLKEDE